jgi:hypothetical protein
MSISELGPYRKNCVPKMITKKIWKKRDWIEGASEPKFMGVVALTIVLLLIPLFTLVALVVSFIKWQIEFETLRAAFLSIVTSVTSWLIWAKRVQVTEEVPESNG